MSYARGGAFSSLGRNLMGIGSQLGDERVYNEEVARRDAELARAEAERARIIARQENLDALSFADAGGRTGPMPTIEQEMPGIALGSGAFPEPGGVSVSPEHLMPTAVSSPDPDFEPYGLDGYRERPDVIEARKHGELVDNIESSLSGMGDPATRPRSEAELLAMGLRPPQDVPDPLAAKQAEWEAAYGFSERTGILPSGYGRATGAGGSDAPTYRTTPTWPQAYAAIKEYAESGLNSRAALDRSGNADPGELLIPMEEWGKLAEQMAAGDWELPTRQVAPDTPGDGPPQRESRTSFGERARNIGGGIGQFLMGAMGSALEQGTGGIGQQVGDRSRGRAPEPSSAGPGGAPPLAETGAPPDGEVRAAVQELAARGMTQDQIRSILLQQGASPEQVRRYLNQ